MNSSIFYIMNYIPILHYFFHDSFFFFQFYEWKTNTETVIAKKRPKSKVLRLLLFGEKFHTSIFFSVFETRLYFLALQNATD